MRLSTIWFTLGGILVGFVVGFLTASSFNRSVINQLRGEVETARNTQSSASNTGSETLSDEEIRDKIAEADQNPTNATFQKNLGLALYRYGAMKNDTKLISESVRLMERASKLQPSDADLIVGLGNAWFDIGYANKDTSAFDRSRGYYQSALTKTPQDADVRTDLGMTYFLTDPPDDKKATEQFKLALADDPKNEKTLQFIIQSLARQGDNSSAQKYLQKLREDYPNDNSIDSLAKQIGSQSNSNSK
jgi:tetratricopeptide (TPR) repeat protein